MDTPFERESNNPREVFAPSGFGGHGPHSSRPAPIRLLPGVVRHGMAASPPAANAAERPCRPLQRPTKCVPIRKHESSKGVSTHVSLDTQ